MPKFERAQTVAPASVTVARPGLKNRQFMSRRGIWIFLVPAVLFYIFVVVWPSAQGAGLSLFHWNGISADREFVGLRNFQTALADPKFWSALGNTLLIAVTVTIVQNILGLLFALGANSQIKSKNVIRVIMFTPVVVTSVASGFLFRNIFGSTGALNTFLESVGLGSWTQAWLGDSSLAIWMVIIVIIWQFTGYSMVIFLANLQGIPAELLEAAEIDGAGPWRRFWDIIRPQLTPAVTICIMLSVIGSLKQFDQVWVMTGGGPNGATETLSTLLYRSAFQFGQMSYGITLGVLLTVVVLIFAIVQNRAVARQTRAFK